jgi:Cyclin, C-terminal domain
MYGNKVDRVHLNSVMELSRFLTELSVIDYYFVTISASSVALASILNAMHILHLDDIQAEFRNQLRILDNCNPDCDEVNASRSRLGELFLQSGHCWSHLSTSSDLDRSDTESPICVTKYSVGIQIPKT